MSIEKGALYTCGCCGKTYFAKYLGENEASVYNSKFLADYQAPKGWYHSDSYFLGDTSFDIFDVCDDCLDKIKTSVRNTINRIREGDMCCD